MSNWTANDILLRNRKTSHLHRSDRLTSAKDASRLARNCSAGMKLLFRNSVVPPRSFLNDRFVGFRDGYDFK
jgi:hypothetical protein